MNYINSASHLGTKFYFMETFGYCKTLDGMRVHGL